MIDMNACSPFGGTPPFPPRGEGAIPLPPLGGGEGVLPLPIWEEEKGAFLNEKSPWRRSCVRGLALGKSGHHACALLGTHRASYSRALGM